MLNDRFRENALHCREPFGSLVEEGLMSSLHQHQAPLPAQPTFVRFRHEGRSQRKPDKTPLLQGAKADIH
ncbi:hypothetical protein DS909_18865 [Phaeobacter gallaeciensis]|uniref:Uncharacterized protein n=1 Tax=Phaeobacter gallaeciensis TaxID=60890 RepID=A0A366WNP3_9RHOB|nr:MULTISPECIES: hypothetical protein [Roseobacteraceae]RBW51645.1 hypothetical protein DS909_18865 [Phaeobacter gallaeciensis]